MIINNTNVRGIWSYSSDLVYEKGDFVVVGDRIYICKASGVQGIEPGKESSRDYFTEYPGNMVRSLEEYYDIVNNPQASDDLYISSRVLNEILQDSYFGLGDSGIITSTIEADGSLKGQIDKLKNSEHILDSLITAPGFNNGVVLVSRNFKDIKNLVGLEASSTDTTTRTVLRIDQSKCTSCGACNEVCPENAIVVTTKEKEVKCPVCGRVYSKPDARQMILRGLNPDGLGYCLTTGCSGLIDIDFSMETKYSINTNSCTLCGLCANSCPTGAIYEESVETTVAQLVSGDGNQSFSNLISKYQVNDLEYVFVRQYSYKSGATGALHRIQELVDPDQGLIFFRHATQKDGSLTMDSTSWQSCLSRDGVLIGKELNRIREKLGREETVKPISGFKYRSIIFDNRNNDAYFIPESSLPTIGSGVKRIVTLVLEFKGTLDQSSYSASIDLSEDLSGEGKTFYINDNISFQVKSAAGGYDLLFDVESGILDLKDVYCREAC